LSLSSPPFLLSLTFGTFLIAVFLDISEKLVWVTITIDPAINQDVSPIRMHVFQDKTGVADDQSGFFALFAAAVLLERRPMISPTT